MRKTPLEQMIEALDALYHLDAPQNLPITFKGENWVIEAEHFSEDESPYIFDSPAIGIHFTTDHEHSGFFISRDELYFTPSHYQEMVYNKHREEFILFFPNSKYRTLTIPQGLDQLPPITTKLAAAMIEIMKDGDLS